MMHKAIEQKIKRIKHWNFGMNPVYFDVCWEDLEVCWEDLEIQENKYNTVYQAGEKGE